MKLVALRELADLLQGRMPRFITHAHADPNEGGYVPIFTFHSLEPRDFKAKLEHLRRNHYRTVTLDQVVSHLTGGTPLPERAVALTIDDARLTTWTVGLPLLRRYGMTATAFVIPGYTPEGEPRPTLDDVDAGQLQHDEIADRQSNCNWAELAAMQASGHVQIESHTMLHRRVMTSAAATQRVPSDYDNHRYLVPAPLDAVTPWDRVPVGAPLGPARPLLAVDTAFDPGGSTPRDTADTQRWELVESRRLIEARLPGKVVRHFCYPESAGTPRTLAMLHDAGYVSACWGRHDARLANHADTDPLRLGRLKHDHILALPGDGRTPLLHTLATKSLRRLTGRTGF